MASEQPGLVYARGAAWQKRCCCLGSGLRLFGDGRRSALYIIYKLSRFVCAAIYLCVSVVFLLLGAAGVSLEV